MNLSNDINLCIDEKIRLAQDLVDKIAKDFIHVEGAKKVKSNLEKERNFLQKVNF